MRSRTMGARRRSRWGVGTAMGGMSRSARMLRGMGILGMATEMATGMGMAMEMEMVTEMGMGMCLVWGTMSVRLPRLRFVI